MIKYLSLQGQGGGATVDPGVTPSELAANRDRPTDHRQDHLKTLSKNAQTQQQFTDAALNSSNSKGSGGLFAKYKNMKGRRRSQGSDKSEDKQSDNPALLEYSPLSKGENGEGRVDIEASSSPFSEQVRILGGIKDLGIHD